ncbi:MAG TPA: hypothetical protein VFW39_04735 [Sphingomicrobium sp.]|nr:hypothetical protein [Sphingomicrobium sp.]
MTAADDASAEAFVSALRTISAGERRKHASVYNYWLAIRRDRDFPPIHDLDPLEISDAGPFSLLFEMIGGGEDAEIRHIGQAIAGGVKAEKISDAPNPSLLSCIAKRLPVVAACRDAFAFEEEFETADGKAHCWVTLLPFSATGTWIDFVYGFVSLGGAAAGGKADADTGAEESDHAESLPEPAELVLEDPVETIAEPAEEIVEQEEAGAQLGPIDEIVEAAEIEQAPAAQASAAESAKASGKAGFSSKFFETLANVGGFYGKPVEVELDIETASLESWDSGEPASEDVQPEEPVSEEPVAAEPEPEELVLEEIVTEEAAPAEPEVAPEPAPSKQVSAKVEGTLQSKLTEVRAKADEARQAKLRANMALYEGLSAAYDFALDAEDTPDEYLSLVQAEGLKVQLRSPMKPVAKLAFDGMCDDATIKQLEAILAWAFEEELPRGTLAERIEAAGGIAPILSGQAKAA